MTKKQIKTLDDLIAALWTANCAGIAINVMDIGQVFTAARAAHAAGQDMTAAIIATVAQLRQN